MTAKNLSALAAELDRDLKAIRAILRRPLESEIARGHLTAPQQSVLSTLVRHGPMSLKELSAHLGLAHSTTSGIVDRLEKRGMVERRPGEQDRRLSSISVIREVREFVERTMPAMSLHPLAAALRGAAPAERQAILDALKTLRTLLERGTH